MEAAQVAELTQRGLGQDGMVVCHRRFPLRDRGVAVAD
jgi:hypothetical protein